MEQTAGEGQLEAFLERYQSFDHLHPLLRACLSPVHTFQVRPTPPHTHSHMHTHTPHLAAPRPA